MAVIRRPARSLPLRPPSPEPTRKNPAVVAAAITAVGTVVTGVFGLVGPIAAADRTPAGQPCAVLAHEHRELADAAPYTVDVPSGPPRDGQSIADGHDAAAGC